MSYFDDLQKNHEQAEEGKSILGLEDFECKLLNVFQDSEVVKTKWKAVEFGLGFDKNSSYAKVYKYDGSEVITICPEPLEFIKEFDDLSDNVEKCNSLFIEKIKNFRKIKLCKKPIIHLSKEHDPLTMWVNKTLEGICLRPGIENTGNNNLKPVIMCDDNVHGLVVGRTGSGKSVFINALILSLITEYAPWELNLYLADFKKVELSRYMNNSDSTNDYVAFTPHVMACAATSEIRYVISMIRYLVNCMNARNEFFARVGVTKLQEFREKYNLVLPRVLLLVDEFQQMFTEATSREQEELQVMLNSITKLGRATGFHLIFASQEMTGTLRGNTLANFKIRMALPCSSEISASILGNSEAARLQRGNILINMESGDAIDNIKYKVPFIKTELKDNETSNSVEKSPFFKYLDKIKQQNKLYPFKDASVQKFYREELQEQEKSFLSDLERIRAKKNEVVASNKDIFDAVVLGSTVLYTTRKNDKVSFCIEKGQNKCIIIATPDIEKAARIRKLLAENLSRSDQPTTNICIEQNTLIYSKFNFDKFLNKYPLHTCEKLSLKNGISYLFMKYYFRKTAYDYLRENWENFVFAKENYKKLMELINNDEYMKQFYKNKKRLKVLSEEINNIKYKIDQMYSKKNKTKHPIEIFLKLCSDSIVIIPKENKKANVTILSEYKNIINIYNEYSDIKVATQKSMEIIDTTANNCSNNVEKLFYIVFKRMIDFFEKSYEGKPISDNKFGGKLETIYNSIEEDVQKYKSLFQSDIDTERYELLLEEYNKIRENIKLADDLLSNIQELVNKALDVCYKTYIAKIASSNKKEEVNIRVEMEINNNEVSRNVWLNSKLTTLPFFKECIDDIINYFMDIFKNDKSVINSDDINFSKNIFWINGLDELEKIPRGLDEVFRDAINHNVLVIAIITSELRDTLIRKNFDYAFVTGNIPKFYDMFGLKYTRQEPDSIVVNFSIKSSDIEIPFKIYKSDLEETPKLSFVDDLLESV